jgi:predicted nucleic acid-binding protein
MTLVADTSGILAAIDVRHDTHQRCLDAIVGADAVLVSPMVLAELDYMIAQRFGVKAALGFLDDVIAGVYEVARVESPEVVAARAVMRMYVDLNIGLTDAMNVVLADRCGTDRILTLDQRHFRAVRPLSTARDAFRLLPFDTV